jgi:hypothetical protein
MSRLPILLVNDNHYSSLDFLVSRVVGFIPNYHNFCCFALFSVSFFGQLITALK